MEGRKMRILDAPNLRRLVKGANELGIKQTDIVQLLIIDNGYALVYYG